DVVKGAMVNPEEVFQFGLILFERGMRQGPALLREVVPPLMVMRAYRNHAAAPAGGGASEATITTGQFTIIAPCGIVDIIERMDLIIKAETAAFQHDDVLVAPRQTRCQQQARNAAADDAIGGTGGQPCIARFEIAYRHWHPQQ